MRKNFLTIIIISLLIISNSQAQTAAGLLSKMLDAVNAFKCGKYVLHKEERIDGKMFSTEMIVKVNSSPLKIYSYSINPDPGAEILFLAGMNNGNVLVKPNKFPYVNLNLSPFGSILRKNQHHTVYEMGFSYIGSIVSHSILTKQKEFYSSLSYAGETDWKGKSYYKLVIDNTTYAIENYTVLQGENLYIIGRKLFVGDYEILSLNKNISDFDDVKPGQVIKVPNSYARKIELYLDKTNYLPVVQVIYDEKGLYAQYEFSSLLVNCDIKPEEFTSTYKDYKF